GPTMAIFALLGPVMAVVSWLDERRRVRRDRRQREHDHQVATAAFIRAVQTAASRARAEAVARHPDPCELVRRAVERDSRLWERYPGDDDFLEVAIGTGDTPWLDTPRCSGADDMALSGVVPHTLAAAPIVLDLRGSRAVGIAGRPDD